MERTLEEKMKHSVGRFPREGGTLRPLGRNFWIVPLTRSRCAGLETMKIDQWESIAQDILDFARGTSKPFAVICTALKHLYDKRGGRN